MTEEIINEEEVFMTVIDAEGNITQVPAVWHAVIPSATLIFYVVHLQVNS